MVRARTLDFDGYEAVVQHIYAGILAADEWDRVIATLSDALGFSQGSILRSEAGRGGTSVIRSYNLDPKFAQVYEETYCTIDPGKRFVANLAAGAWYFDDNCLQSAFKARSEFYQDFMRPHGFTSNICAALHCSQESMAGLSFQSSEKKCSVNGPIPQRELSSLISHLSKAVALRCKFDDLAQKASLGQQLVDRVSMPVMIVNKHADVLYANTAGESWLRNVGANAASSTGISRKQLLLEAVARLFAHAHAVTLPDSSNSAQYCESVLVGLPITRAHPIGLASDESLGLVLVHERAHADITGVVLLGQLYGLSAAEQRLVVAWVEHGSMRAAAETLKVSIETVRTQIKNVFAKTGCNRQIDLARLIDQLSLLM